MTVASAEAPLLESRGRDGIRTLSWKRAVLLICAAVACFHVAYAVPALSFLILVYVYVLVALGSAITFRLAFRCGFAVGMLTFSPQLLWFWNIFGPASICLWAVLSFFTGLFVGCLQWWSRRFEHWQLILIAPILWTGLEYFRGELYYLRFSWLTVGSAFAEKIGSIPVAAFGIYGVGFLLFALVAMIRILPAKRRIAGMMLTCGMIAGLVHWPLSGTPPQDPKTAVRVAGIQLEFPPELQIPEYLDRVLSKEPTAQVLVLSEYALDGGVSKRLRDWCRENQRYLIVGGKDDVGTNYYNTAFVVDPRGEVVFKQAKSVPIQFFKDGLPARTQEVWNSPWGKIAMCVCYDLSYRRVTDRFAAKGPQAMIVPFMDITDWGEHQHRLHARVAPIRAREYGVPVFRLGSSGISQNVDARGNIRAKSSFPGPEQVFSGDLFFGPPAKRPLDTWLAPACSMLAGAFMCGMLLFRKSGPRHTGG